MSVYRRYEDALVAKLRLLEFNESHVGEGFMRGFQQSMNAKHQIDERLPDGMLHALQLQTLREAEPIYVSMDMAEVVDHARHSFQPETLLPSDPFVPCGFALFPKPILLDDAPRTENTPMRSEEGIIPVRALAWMAIHSEDLSQGCFWCSHYTHIEDDKNYGRHFVEGEDDQEAERIYGEMARIAPLSLVHTWQWTWGSNPANTRAGLIEDEDPDVSEARALAQSSFVQSFWRIASQLVPVKRRVPRQMWRQAERRRAKPTREVTVITLRRDRDVGDEEPIESGRHYTVTFPVRGYWAIRHTKDGPRQVWVRPHMKGQGPLQVTDRAWEFRR